MPTLQLVSISIPIPEKATTLFKKFKVPSLEMKSHKVAGSRENSVVLDNTINTNGIAIYLHQDL